MLFNNIEPFIILPYQNKQDILFFSGESVRNYSDVLISNAYSELSNKIVKDNLIKVIVKFNYIVIYHIYPTSFKEVCSGRGGQNLVIGYVISKRALIKNFDYIIAKLETFFDTIKECVKGNHVPTCFLNKVNNSDNIEVMEKLENCRELINDSQFGYFFCFNFLQKSYVKYSLKMKKNRMVNSYSKNRLSFVYKYIIKHSIINKEFWILVDCEEEKYYNFKNMHLINFIEK